MSFKYYEDPILGKGRALVDNGSGGSGGSAYIGGDRINIAGGTISFVNSADIVNVSGTSVTLQPDTAYKIYATSQAITLNANPPAAGKWAYDGHIELFVAGTGYVVTGPNVVLANALEPDAVNNCTVRFHDGLAIIAVEDHVAGYIVVNGSASGDGSLYYGITTSTNDYVAFDASLNGTTTPLAGAVAEGEKHMVGNGYTETAITGAVDCGTSKFTVANLSLQNVQVTGGTMTFGDAYIPSGSTVAVSGGRLAVEKVAGAGETSEIDLGGTNVVIPFGGTAHASGCVISGGSASNGGAFYASNGTLDLTSCTIAYNRANSFGKGIYAVGSGAIVYLTGCTMFNNGTTTSTTLQDVAVRSNAVISAMDCSFAGEVVLVDGGSAVLLGSNRLEEISEYTTNRGGTVIISSGAIVDLTGNTNSTPIAPGGGITFEEGRATVKVGDSTASSSYMLDNVTLPAGAKLTNTAVVNLGGTNVVIPSGGTAHASGCIFSGGSAGGGGAINVKSGGNAHITSCLFTGNNADMTSGLGGALYISYGCAELLNCTISGNNAAAGKGVCVNGGTCTIVNCDISDNIDIRYLGRVTASGGTITSMTLGSGCLANLGETMTIGAITSRGTVGGIVTISSGAVLDLTGNTNTAPIAPGGGVIVDGGCQVITSAGTTVSIAGGTYTKINNDGTTE